MRLKGISPLIGFVLVIVIAITAVSIVLVFGQNIINQAQDAGVVNEATQNMNTLDSMIQQVATEGPGTILSTQLRSSGGTYRVNSVSGDMEFSYILKSNLFSAGTFRKNGPLTTSIITSGASATSNSTNLILDNGILQVVLQRVGNSSSPTSINTSTLIQSITFKNTGATVTPNDTSVIIGNVTNSSWGTGYTQLAAPGIFLTQAQAIASVQSAATGNNYQVTYTLPSATDFLEVSVTNVTSSNQTTMNYAYHLGTASNDIVRINGNENVFVANSSVNSQSQLNLQNTNYTTNSSSFNMNIGNGVVYYNASDGTWRSVNELPNIGEGSNWGYSSTPTTTTVKYSLAGNDGMDYGIRDILPGGSYWLDQNGNSLDSGLVGYWKLSEGSGTTTADSSGNNNTGTLTNSPTWVVGKFGNALQFNGSNYVQFPSNGLGTNGLGQVSASAWFYISATSANEKIFSVYSSGTNAAFIMGLANSATYIELFLNNVDYAESNLGAVTVGAWHLLTLTWSNANSYYTVYLDGVSIGTVSTGGTGQTFASATAVVNIGALIGSWQFTGKIDDVRVYNRALSADEVSRLYKSSSIQIQNDFISVNAEPYIQTNVTNSTGSTIFNKVPENILLDGTPLTNTYPVNTSTVYFYDWTSQSWKVWMVGTNNATYGVPNWLDPRYKQEFKWRYAFQRPSYPSINYTYLMTAADPFVRIFVDSVNGTINDGMGVGQHNLTIPINLGQPESYFDINGGPGTASSVAGWDCCKDFGNPSTAGTNNRVLYIFNNSGIFSFNNSNALRFSDSTYNFGKNIVSFLNSVSSESVLFTTMNFKIGALSKGGHSNAEFRIYNSSSTTQYDTFRYFYNFNATQNNNFLFTLGYTGNINTVNWNTYSNSTCLGSPCDTTIGFSNESLESVANSTLTYYDISNITSNSSVNWYDNSTGTNLVQHNFSTSFNYDGGAAGIWHFDEGAGSNVTDASGNGNNGYVNGAAWITNSSCKFRSCLSFVGGNVSIPKSKSINITGPQTIAVWFNIPISQGSNSVLVGTDYQTTNSGFNLWFGGGGTTPAFTVYNTSNSFTATGNSVSLNTWQFVVGVYDGSNVKIYQNGMLIQSVTGPSLLSPNPGPLIIGELNGGGSGLYFYNGTMDEVRLYPYALTSTQIQEMYLKGSAGILPSNYYDDFGTATGKTYRYFGVEDSNTSMEPITPSGTVLHLRFNDNSTTNVTDSSGYGNNGMIIGGATWLTNSSCMTNFGGCMKFDGSTGYVTINSPSPTLNLTGPYTFSVWFNYASNAGNNFPFFTAKNSTTFNYYFGHLNGHLTIQTGSTNAYGTDSINSNVWNNAIVSYNGTNANFYLNGQSVGSPSFSTNPYGNLINFYVGYDGGSLFNGTIDEVLIINRSLSADEVYQLYLGGYNRTINGNTHRVASADGIYSTAYNLTTKNNTFGTQDYSMRILFVNGSTPQTPSPVCYTNPSEKYVCSYDQTDYNPSVVTALIPTASSYYFDSLCYDQQNSNNYKFNVTVNGNLNLVIPVTQGTCAATIGNKISIVQSQGTPSTSFASVNVQGQKTFDLQLSYDRIELQGNLRIGSGTFQVCVQKTGVDNGRAVVNVTSC